MGDLRHFSTVSKMRTLDGPLLKSYLCGASEKVQTCVTETQTRRPEFGNSEPASQSSNGCHKSPAPHRYTQRIKSKSESFMVAGPVAQLVESLSSPEEVEAGHSED